MSVWTKEGGESEGSPVMGEIGIEHQQYHPTRKRADFHPVFHHENVWRTNKGGKANDG
jgi:hypothetical protein